MSLLETIRSVYPQLYDAERKVADTVLKDPDAVLRIGVTELANLSEVSDATVVRFSKKVGAGGYYEFKLRLANELGQANKNQLSRQGLEEKPDGGIFGIQCAVMNALQQHVSPKILEDAARMIRQSRAVFVVAAGNTIPLAQELSFRLHRMRIRSYAGINDEMNLNYVNLAEAGDMVIAISHTGSSISVIEAVNLAHKKNCKVLLISGALNSPLHQLADLSLSAESFGRSSKIPGIESHIVEYAFVDAIVYELYWNMKDHVIDHLELILSTKKV